jgi:midasin (ATPase involved in ribosome maturation)
VDHTSLNVTEASWNTFDRDVSEFEVQHVQGKGKFAFDFVEGPLVRALRSGDWYELLHEMPGCSLTFCAGFFLTKSI